MYVNEQTMRKMGARLRDFCFELDGVLLLGDISVLKILIQCVNSSRQLRDFIIIETGDCVQTVHGRCDCHSLLLIGSLSSSRSSHDF